MQCVCNISKHRELVAVSSALVAAVLVLQLAAKSTPAQQRAELGARLLKKIFLEPVNIAAAVGLIIGVRAAGT